MGFAAFHTNSFFLFFDRFIPYLMFDVISHANLTNLTKLKILFAGLARFA